MCIVAAVYKKNVVKRYDDEGTLKYYTHEDYPGLHAEPIEFMTPHGETLKGNFYSYDGAAEDSIVVFAHGLGGGHQAYMSEIERICRAGYRVVGYDNCGCFASEGKNIRGLTESLGDLIACIDWFRGQERYAGLRVSVIGHSWGGYAAANLLNYRKVHAVVAISCFVSVGVFVDAFLKGKPAFIKRGIYNFERRANPDLVASCAVDAVRDTDAKVLFIHSSNDDFVPSAVGLDYVRERVNNPHVEYLVVDGKYHNPNYTADAVEYMRSTFGEYNRRVASKELRTFEEKRDFCAGFDFARMTAQDEDVWKVILDHVK